MDNLRGGDWGEIQNKPHRVRTKCEFSSKLRFYIKDWSPSGGSGATVGLIFPEIFVSPLSEFQQHMYSSDPGTDTGSLMQLESRRAVPQASQPPIIQSLCQDI
ncbi:unnamed protein product [Porites lobata]|uniref:Uncharacterized protein n=1 Tax=Porites lobata TaxID=104759 RepID=A0ABN8S8V2_9CNID|nr:unnamed protein product [Porites lobata]